MTDTDLQKLIESILKRGHPAYTTQSGAFLAVLQDFAKEQKIETFAEAIDLYTKTFHGVAPFIHAQVPHILINNYFPIRTDLDYTKFIRWVMKNEGQLARLSAGCRNPVALRQAVDSIVNEVTSWDG